MKKVINIAVMLLAAFSMSSCYEKFDDPAPARVWEDSDFSDATIISIKELKDLFYKQYGDGAASLARTYEVTENYVIRGKIISSDQAGNVYKSVYIYDEKSEAAIELKLMVSNWVNYHVGQTVYVRAKGMAIGSYRYMLSLGAMPTEEDIAKGYANRNMEDYIQVSKHIFLGARGTLNANDYLEVDGTSYNKLTDSDLGRLVRFKDLSYNVGTLDGDRYPQYLEVTYPGGSTTGVYTNKYFEDEGLPPTYAYNYNNNRYYGTSWFGYKGATSTTVGNYLVRVSGYANFGLHKLPAEDSKGNLTAIYTKYSSKSGGYIKYQLLVNSSNDIEFN
ncbi:MAG: DUF5689 domain-containing protein [Phocaeicola sp.]